MIIIDCSTIDYLLSNQEKTGQKGIGTQLVYALPAVIMNQKSINDKE